MHAAPHDLLVLQIAGAKSWELCIPTGQMVLPVVNLPPGYDASSRHAAGDLPDAITAALHDIFIRSQRPAWTATANPGSSSWSAETGEDDGIDYERLYRDFPLASIDFKTQMKCTKVVLTEGDRLYIPAGILHRAKAAPVAGAGSTRRGSGSGSASVNGDLDPVVASVHLTFGLQKFGRTTNYVYSLAIA